MEYLTSFAILVALTMGITQAIKIAFKIPNKFIPLISLALGFGIASIGSAFDFSPLNILTGIAVGLSACGLFDQTKLLKK